LAGLQWLSLLIPLIVVGIFALVIGLFVISAIRTRKLLQTGEIAQATILSINTTGVTVNDNPQARFALEVRPANRPPFRAEAKKIVSMFEIMQYQPGTILEVRFDPNKPSEIAIAGIIAPARTINIMQPFMGGNMPINAQVINMNPNPMMGMNQGMVAPNPAPQSPQVQEILQRIENLNRELSLTGEAAPANVIAAWDMNIQDAWGSRVMGFMVQVRPISRESFQAEAKAIVPPNLIPRFQPGANIQVRFDRDDITKIAIEVT
jgi:hypothetical protein